MAADNVNFYWSYVKKQYPEAIFKFWYRIGELLFYANKEMEQKNIVYHCFKKEDGRYVIVTGV